MGYAIFGFTGGGFPGLFELSLNFLSVLKAGADIERYHVPFVEPSDHANDLAIIFSHFNRMVVNFAVLIHDGNNGIISLNG